MSSSVLLPEWFAKPGMLSPLTAIVFSVICWIIFARVFDATDPTQLPNVTRGFLAIQPWWLAAGALGLLGHLFAASREEWKPAVRVYEGALMIASVLGMAWGIIAIFVLSLPPANF